MHVHIRGGAARGRGRAALDAVHKYNRYECN